MSTPDTGAKTQRANDGGPAFPSQFIGYPGLTKREYFAGLALAGLMSRESLASPNAIAIDCVLAADALIARLEET